MRHLTIDGTDAYGMLTGDARQGPFWVFDVDKQDWIAGPFRYRWRAVLAKRAIQKAKG